MPGNQEFMELDALGVFLRGWLYARICASYTVTRAYEHLLAANQDHSDSRYISCVMAFEAQHVHVIALIHLGMRYVVGDQFHNVLT